ncbi:MAG: hypothetical protein WC955_04870 [Elusimicrobiota bacterium]
MKVLKVENTTEAVTVTTTGAMYKIYKNSVGTIECYQRIGKQRLLATMRLNSTLENLEVDHFDDNKCILYKPLYALGVNIRINADSSMYLRTYATVKVVYNSTWSPEYFSVEQQNFIAIDPHGGIAGYTLPTVGNGGVSEINNAGTGVGKDGWAVTFSITYGQQFITSVFPPREYDHKKAYTHRIVHHLVSRENNTTWTPYLSDNEIRKYSKYGNVLVLHWWSKGFATRKGKAIKSRNDIYKTEAAWSSYKYLPINPRKLQQVLTTAHKHRMKVIAYMTPFFYPGDLLEFIPELKRVVKTYGFDGIYFDGVPTDVVQAHTVMRETRKVLGNKLFYVHMPSPIITKDYSGGRYVYFPFIDTYADYILRAEHVLSFTKQYLRYVISGYNISNAVGFVCNYDYSPDFVKKLIPDILKSQVRIPYWTGWEVYLKELGKNYFPEDKMHEVMHKHYFPALRKTKV